MKKQMSRAGRRQGGFTLIELMIVVAIVGILAAVAIPRYQDYTVRAKMSEVVNMMSPAKTSISEYYISEGKFPTSETQAGVQTGAQGNYIASAAYSSTAASSTNETSATATITYTLKSAGTDGTPSEVGGGKIGMKAEIKDGAVVWTCGTPSSGGIDEEYLPSSCRNTI